MSSRREGKTDDVIIVAEDYAGRIAPLDISDEGTAWVSGGLCVDCSEHQGQEAKEDSEEQHGDFVFVADCLVAGESRRELGSLRKK